VTERNGIGKHNTPVVEDISIEDNKLIFKLDSQVPNNWFDIFVSETYDHNYIEGYSPSKYRQEKECNIFVCLNNTESQQTISDIVKFFKEWLVTVTDLYNIQSKCEYEKNNRREIEKIKREINQKEKKQTLNEFVQSLI